MPDRPLARDGRRSNTTLPERDPTSSHTSRTQNHRRDSEIFEHGPGKVIRVARDGRSLVAEAEIMRYVRTHDYPCPDVYDAGDGYLIMDRLEG